MTDQYEHNLDDHEDPAASSTWLIGFIGSVLLIVTMLGITALYYNVKTAQVDTEVVQPDIDDVTDARNRQERHLTDSARWVERDEGGEVVRALAIPIDRAMELIVAENSGATSGGTP